MAGKQVIMHGRQTGLRAPSCRRRSRRQFAPMAFVFVSGYVPLNPETGKAELGPIEVQARRTLEND